MQINTTNSDVSGYAASLNSRSSSVATESFSSELSRAEKSQSETDTRKQADFVSGRLGLNLNGQGIPYQMVYFDESGNISTKSSFDAQEILKKTASLGIPLTDLKDLGSQMDEKAIGYRPYELYKGTGSDHGINFDDLINGGLGTAYDWRYDANASLKGSSAVARQKEAKEFADSLGLKSNPKVTANKGIDPEKFTALKGKDGSLYSYAVFNGGSASWYKTEIEAGDAKKTIGGTIFNLDGNETINESKDTAGTKKTDSPAAEKSANDNEDTSDKVQNTAETGMAAEKNILRKKDEPGSDPLNAVDIMLKRLSAPMSMLMPDLSSSFTNG